MIKSLVRGTVCLLVVVALSSLGIAQQMEEETLKTRLVGKWAADVEKTLEFLKENAGDESSLEMMKDMLPGMALEFTADEKMMMRMKMGPETNTSNGSYSVTEVDVEKGTLALTVSMEDQEDEKTGTVTFDGEDSFKLETDSGDTIFFKRAPKAEDEDIDGDDDEDDEDDDDEDEDDDDEDEDDDDDDDGGR